MFTNYYIMTGDPKYLKFLEDTDDSNLEMSWMTFGGDYYEIYDALMKAWCLRVGLPLDEDTLTKYFRLNLERGIAHLCGTGFIKSIDDLLELAVK